MKQKILINGRNQNMVSDFMQHMENQFDIVSTSSYWNDIIGHFRFFQPEVYLVFIDSNVELTIKQLTDLRDSDFYNGASIVVVGDGDSCSTVERRSRDLANLIIRRPVTPDSLALRITRHIEDANSERASRTAFAEKTQQMDAIIKAAEAALGDATTAFAASGKKHILIVDDDRTVLKMLKAALDGRYDVTTMANGGMIDRVLSSKFVDLIILDYEMPVETGADIFKRLKKVPRYSNIPVVFLTGVSERDKIMEVMSLKPNGYILKPIDMDMLSSTITSILG